MEKKKVLLSSYDFFHAAIFMKSTQGLVVQCSLVPTDLLLTDIWILRTHLRHYADLPVSSIDWASYTMDWFWYNIQYQQDQQHRWRSFRGNRIWLGFDRLEMGWIWPFVMMDDLQWLQCHHNKKKRERLQIRSVQQRVSSHSSISKYRYLRTEFTDLRLPMISCLLSDTILKQSAIRSNCQNRKKNYGYKSSIYVPLMLA